MAGRVALGALLSVLAAAAAGRGPSVKEHLQAIQDGLQKQGDEDKTASDKLGCWCETNLKEKQQLVDDSNQQLTQLGHDIESQSAETSRLNLEVKDHQAEFDASSHELQTAEALREKDADKFSQDEQSQVTSVSALDDALKALEGPRALSLAAVRRRVSGMHAGSPKAKALLLQLEGATDPDMIYGILKQMKSSFHENLEDMREDEKRAKERHEGLVDAKTQQIDALKKQLTAKRQRAADGEVQVQQKKKQQSTAEALLQANQELLLGMKELCQKSEAAYTARQEARQAELVALSGAQADLAGAGFLAVAARSIPAQGSGAQAICNAALEIVDSDFRSRAKEACEKAKAGNMQDASDATESLKADVEAAQKAAQEKVEECRRSNEEASSKAHGALEATEAQAGVVGTDKEAADSEIESIKAQSASNEKAKTELSQATSALHSVMQEIRLAANHGEDLLHRAVAEAAPPAKGKLGDALAASQKLAGAAADFDSQHGEEAQKVTDLLDKAQRSASKALIPLKLMRADAEEAAVNLHEQQESEQAMGAPTCDVDGLGAKVTTLEGYAKHLGDAAEALAYEALR